MLKRNAIWLALFYILFFYLLSLSTFADEIREAERYYKEGFQHYINDNHGDAIASLQKAIELQPDYSDAYFQLGEVYARMGENQKAEQNYLKAKELYLKENNQVQIKRIESIFRVKAMIEEVEKRQIKPTKAVAVTIISPRSGDVFHPGDTVHIKVDAAKEVSMALIMAGPYASTLDIKPPFELIFTLPDDASLGQIEISAGGRDELGQSFGSDEITISIK